MRTILILLITASLTSQAQEQPTLQKRANAAYLRNEYAPAAYLYGRIMAGHKKRKDSLEIMRRIADSRQQLNDYTNAAYWYARILQSNLAPAITHLHYGDVLRSLGRYEEARQQYLQCPAADGDAALLKQRLAGCDSALEWNNSAPAAKVVNETMLNSAHSDWGLILYSNSQLVFTSDRLDEEGSGRRYRRNRHPYLKLYQADALPAGFGYTRRFVKTFTGFPYHAGPVCFSPAYDTAYLTITNARRKVAAEKGGKPIVYGQRRLEIMVYIKKNGRWIGDALFPYNNVDSFSTGHAALSPNGGRLYFTSDRPGSIGQTDIWYCEKLPDGSWGAPQNAGAMINTQDEEAFPAVAHDNTLYFASKGWAGLGGFDLFRAGVNANTPPVNLRPPFNSPADDFSLITDAAGNAFFSSNRVGGRGDDDIYSVQMPMQADTTSKPAPPALVIPFTAIVCPPLDACIYLFNKKRGIGWCYLAQIHDGTINATLEADTDYELRIYRSRRPLQVIPFNTNGMQPGQTLTKRICE